MRSARPRPPGEGAEETLEASPGLKHGRKHGRNHPGSCPGPGQPPSSAPETKRSAATSGRTLAEKAGVECRAPARLGHRWDTDAKEPSTPRTHCPGAAILRPGALTCRAPCVAPPPAPAPRARGGRAGAAAERRGGGGDKAPGNEWDGPARPFLLTPSGPAGRRQRRPPVSPAAAAREGCEPGTGDRLRYGLPRRVAGPESPGIPKKRPSPSPPRPRKTGHEVDRRPPAASATV
ncbi:unnamed protein product [Coccothraustes coccothraustes]